MLALRIAANLLIIAGCTLCGFFAAQRINERVSTLLELEKALRMLAGKMFFDAMSLPQAFCFCAGQAQEPVGVFFSDFAEGLRRRSGQPLQELWQDTLEASKLRERLSPAQAQTVAQWGGWLGQGTLEDQQKSFEQIRREMGEIVSGAQAVGEKNARLYRKLGALGGLLLAVILF